MLKISHWYLCLLKYSIHTEMMELCLYNWWNASLGIYIILNRDETQGWFWFTLQATFCSGQICLSWQFTFIITSDLYLSVMWPVCPLRQQACTRHVVARVICISNNRNIIFLRAFVVVNHLLVLNACRDFALGDCKQSVFLPRCRLWLMTTAQLSGHMGIDKKPNGFWSDRSHSCHLISDLYLI